MSKMLREVLANIVKWQTLFFNNFILGNTLNFKAY